MSFTLNTQEGDSGFLWPQGLSSLAFDNNFFLRPDFSVELFLTTYAVSSDGKSVSLESLRDDLTTYEQLLAATLIQLVDRDYSDFLNVSSNLHGLGDHVERVLGTMRSLAATVEACKTHFTSHLQQAHSVQLRLRELQAAKLHAQNTKRALKLARIIPSPNSDASSPEDNASRFLQARFVVRFKNLSRSLPASMLSERAHRLVQGCERSLTAYCYPTLVAALLENDAVLFDEALEILQTLDHTQFLAEPLRTGFLIPLFDAAFVCVATLSSYEDAFACLLRAIETGLFQNKCFSSTIISTLHKNDDNLHSDDYAAHTEVLYHILLPTALTLITTRCPSLFKVTSSAEHFLHSYLEGQKFLAAIESHMSSADLRRTFRQHASYRQFLNAWNIPVFFQLSMQRMVAQLEAALRLQLVESLSAPAKEFARNAGDEYKTLQIKKVYYLIWECWSPPDAVVYAIRQLIPRFWRLTLQFLARLNVWLTSDALSAALSSDSSNADDGSRANGTKTSSNIDLKVSLFIALICDMCRFLRFLVVADNESAGNSGANNLSVLLKTVLNSRESYDNSGPGEASDKNQAENILSESSFDESLTIARDSLAITVQRCIDEFSAHFSRILCSAVASVHETPRLYRKTNRDLNWKPSAYIERVMRLLLLCKPLAQTYPDVAKVFLTRVLQPVFAEYAKQIKVTLDAVRKTEESLRRLRMVRSAQVSVVENGSANTAAADGAAGGDRSDSPFAGGKSNKQQQAASNMSDDDKIRTKIYIDVKALRQCVENELLQRTVDSDTSSAFPLVDKHLQELQRDLEQQVQQFIEQ